MCPSLESKLHEDSLHVCSAHMWVPGTLRGPADIGARYPFVEGKGVGERL